jgi:predicted phage terminase large subunit-like protein
VPAGANVALDGHPAAIQRPEPTLTVEDLEREIVQLSPKYLPPTHLRAMTSRVVRFREEPFDLCFSVPPRHSKTETLIHLVACILKRWPELMIGYATYNSDLAKTKSRKAQQLAIANGVELATKSLENWTTTAGGGLLAYGIDGSWTGKGVHFLIVDDPFKNRVEAESSARRERIWEAFTDALYTRIEPRGSCIVLHTRWHEDDLIGRLVGELDWASINMPAITEDPATGLERALWPERWPVEELDKKRRTLNAYNWVALYQGHPRPRGDRMFQDAYTYPVGSPASLGARIAIGLDFAYTERSQADYSVAVVLCRVGDRYFVLDVIRKQVKPPQFLAVLVELAKRYPTARFRLYGSGPELASVAFFRAAMRNRFIEAMPAIGDKFVRAMPVAAAWNAGAILVPGPNEERGLDEPPWLGDYLSELNSFTGVSDRHDDQVDATAAAYDALAQMPGLSGGSSAPKASGRRM